MYGVRNVYVSGLVCVLLVLMAVGCGKRTAPAAKQEAPAATRSEAAAPAPAQEPKATPAKTPPKSAEPDMAPVALGLQNGGFQGVADKPEIAPWKVVLLAEKAGTAIKVPCDEPGSDGNALEFMGDNVAVEQEVANLPQDPQGKPLYAAVDGLASAPDELVLQLDYRVGAERKSLGKAAHPGDGKWHPLSLSVRFPNEVKPDALILRFVRQAAPKAAQAGAEPGRVLVTNAALILGKPQPSAAKASPTPAETAHSAAIREAESQFRTTLANPGFEEWAGTPPKPKGWALLVSPAATTAAMARAEDVKRSGVASLKLTGPDGQGKNAALISTSVPKDLAGHTVAFGAWLYTSDPKRTVLQAVDSWQRYQDARPTETNAWQLVRSTLTLSPETKSLTLAVALLAGEQPVTCYIDDALLTIEPEGSLISNGSFEWWTSDGATPIDWAALDLDTASAPIMARDTETVKFGGSSLKIVGPGAGDKNSAVRSNRVDAAELQGRTVTFRAWVRATDPSKVQIQMVEDWKNYWQARPRKADTWELLEVTQKVQPSAKSVALFISLLPSNPPVTCYVDGASVTTAE